MTEWHHADLGSVWFVLPESPIKHCMYAKTHLHPSATRLHSHNVHILTGNLVRGGWMLLEGNQSQKFQIEINNSLGITLCMLCSLFMIYYYILYLGWFELIL